MDYLKKIIIDCDPGVDDSIAILFALNQKDTEILGISTGVGNCSAIQGAQNALDILKLAGKDMEIPVCVGSQKPLNGEPGEYPTWIHGKNGTANIELEHSDKKPVNQDVEDFLYEKACLAEGEAILVTLGRLTNVAKTIIKYPDFPRKIKKIVTMGGTLYAPGNVSPVCEANIQGDPEAADIVVQAEWEMTMVGLDVTLNTIIDQEIVDTLVHFAKKECQEQVKFIKEQMKLYLSSGMIYGLPDRSPKHDPMTKIVAFDPSVVTTKDMITRIELSGTYTRGQVIADRRGIPIAGKFVRHCIGVDSQKALARLICAFE